MGVGLGLGAFISGFIYDATNARVVFFAAALVVASGWLLVGGAQLTMHCRQRRQLEKFGLHGSEQEPLLQA